MRIQVFELPHQVCAIKDNKKVHITPVLYYRIVNAYKATFEISSLRSALEQRIQTTLEQIFRDYSQDNLRGRTDGICKVLKNEITEDAVVWGVKIEEILFKEFDLSEEAQKQVTPANPSQGHAINVNVIETIKTSDKALLTMT